MILSSQETQLILEIQTYCVSRELFLCLWFQLSFCFWTANIMTPLHTSRDESDGSCELPPQLSSCMLQRCRESIEHFWFHLTFPHHLVRRGVHFDSALSHSLRSGFVWLLGGVCTLQGQAVATEARELFMPFVGAQSKDTCRCVYLKCCCSCCSFKPALLERHIHLLLWRTPTPPRPAGFIISVYC